MLHWTRTEVEDLEIGELLDAHKDAIEIARAMAGAK